MSECMNERIRFWLQTHTHSEVSGLPRSRAPSLWGLPFLPCAQPLPFSPAHSHTPTEKPLPRPPSPSFQECRAHPEGQTMGVQEKGQRHWAACSSGEVAPCPAQSRGPSPSERSTWVWG